MFCFLRFLFKFRFCFQRLFIYSQFWLGTRPVLKARVIPRKQWKLCNRSPSWVCQLAVSKVKLNDEVDINEKRWWRSEARHIIVSWQLRQIPGNNSCNELVQKIFDSAEEVLTCSFWVFLTKWWISAKYSLFFFSIDSWGTLRFLMLNWITV